jgi:predicted acylesterase/phospholipase RssA
MSSFKRDGVVATVVAAMLVMSVAAIPAEAKNKDRCEGTKKQRRQKMEPRDLTKDQLVAMLGSYQQEVTTEWEQLGQTVLRRLERKYEAYQTTGETITYDILVISGGGAKGAFGAGFLEGWGQVPPGPNARPEFDMVTGVSTGALISPFAFVGTTASYASVDRFYANPQANWIKKRGLLYIKPHHVSLFNDCHLQDTIRSVIDEPLVSALADGAAEDRLLLIGTTNLDLGMGRVFDLSQEAQNALPNGSFDRIHSILLASSAIPGIFPPAEISGMYYADGGATSNLFVVGFSGADGPVARFLERHPEAPKPKVRVWVLVNEPFQPEPAVIQPRWVSVAGRALETLMSTSEIYALDLIKAMVHEARTERGVEAEFRVAAIPNDAPKNKTKDMFDEDYMVQMEELGQKEGADPTSWSSEVPSAFWFSRD